MRIILLVGVSVGISDRKSPAEAVTVGGVFRRRRILIQRRAAWLHLPEGCCRASVVQSFGLAGVIAFLDAHIERISSPLIPLVR